MTEDQPAGDPIDPIDLADLDTLLVESSRLMKQGIQLVGEDPGAAIDCFDRALALRQRLPIEVPVLRYDLSACWLNRAEALLAFRGDAGDDDARFDAALRSFDEALALLRTLPLDEDPRFVRRLVIASQNRGRLLAMRARGTAATGEAIASFMDAIGVLDQHGAGIDDRDQLLAAIWMNCATAWIAHDAGSEPALLQAGRAARLAIALIEPFERDEEGAADVSLQARHVLCRVLAATTLTVTPPATIALDDVHDATDLADDALALIEEYESRGVTEFRALACDFFRFGAHVYAAHQPDFVQEFIHEHLDPARSSAAYIESDEMRRAASDTAALRPATHYVSLSVRLE